MADGGRTTMLWQLADKDRRHPSIALKKRKDDRDGFSPPDQGKLLLVCWIYGDNRKVPKDKDLLYTAGSFEQAATGRTGMTHAIWDTIYGVQTWMT
jgi:hypothetical protein